jgi:general secretion pathway protein G
MKMRRSKRAKRIGFTLLEVLLVVGILALLAAFVVPNLIGAKDEANIKLTKAAVGRNGTIANALKRYRLHVGVYPETDEGLAALYEIPDSLDEEDGKWNGPYLDGDPEDLRDPWGREYEYRSPGEFNEESYDLWSLGPDEKDDDDDIKNWREK